MTAPAVSSMPRVLRPMSSRMELRTPPPDPSVPFSGRLLALARQVHGCETWALTRRDCRETCWAEGELAARAWLQGIAEDTEQNAPKEAT